jgi:threonyl-tRNA synthetase
VVGKLESEEGQVDVRYRDKEGADKVIGKFTVDNFVKHLKE